MHHYGEDAVVVEAMRTASGGYEITLRNHLSGAVVTIQVPEDGVFEDPTRKLSEYDAEHIGRELAHELRRVTGL